MGFGRGGWFRCGGRWGAEMSGHGRDDAKYIRGWDRGAPRIECQRICFGGKGRLFDPVAFSVSIHPSHIIHACVCVCVVHTRRKPASHNRSVRYQTFFGVPITRARFVR